MISGEGFTADLALNETHEIKERTTITFDEERVYNLALTIFQTDGTILIKDNLSWEYNLEFPAPPIVGFEKKATNTQDVWILVSSHRKENTNEIWLQGDLDQTEIPTGSWRSIPASGIIPVKLSSKEGVKNVRVKLRNDYQNETDEVNISILFKPLGPQNCKVVLPSYTLANNKVRMKLLAEDALGQMYYRVFGDVFEVNKFTQFQTNEIIEFALSPSEGKKRVVIQMRDIAENYCRREEITLTLDKNYRAKDVLIENELLYTDDPNITAVTKYDGFAEDFEGLEMFVHGDIMKTADTFKWIPYAKNIDIKLTPVNGNRFVRIQYRNLEGLQSGIISRAIFLKPYLIIQGGSAPYTVLPSEIVGLSSLTLEGCETDYINVPYQFSFSCTPKDSSLTVHYYFEDQATKTVTAQFE